MKREKNTKDKLKGGQGSNSRSIRSHNEKTVLHLLRYLKTASRIELAHHTDLTSQSLAMITGSLEKKGLIINVGKQVNGIGQPSFLYRLNAKGVYSIGFNIGRKTLDMMMINFTGEICLRRFFEYSYPCVDVVIEKIKEFISLCRKEFPHLEDNNFAGVGVGIPNFLGSWEREFTDDTRLREWDQGKFEKQLSWELHYPVYFENDMNAATMAAMIKGSGSPLYNFIYLYLGTFVGGGVVMDRRIVRGESNNAGNFGTFLVTVPASSPIYDPGHSYPCQLLSYVSINHLKKFLNGKNLKVPSHNRDFFEFIDTPSVKVERWLGVWLEEIAKLLAQAILISNSVLDLPYVIFDSSLNRSLVVRLCQLVTRNFSGFDITGISVPQIIPGELGAEARALGSAMIPIYEKYVPTGFAINESRFSQDESRDSQLVNVKDREKVNKIFER